MGSGPTRREAYDMLRNLVAGKISREEANDWASIWSGTDRDVEVDDEFTWAMLSRLHGCDIQVSPGEYMYSALDFREWLKEFEGKLNAR
ncbi:hypothetical protein Misp01_74150 [Microtetraspora sp. NBRC 13810]|nr:hypothetical protein Misp01_74150 [Microtetraspora sp. NBRC 13810]